MGIDNFELSKHNWPVDESLEGLVSCMKTLLIMSSIFRSFPIEDPTVSSINCKQRWNICYRYPIPRSSLIQIRLVPHFLYDPLLHLTTVGSPPDWLYNWSMSEPLENCTGITNEPTRSDLNEISLDQNVIENVLHDFWYIKD